MSADTQRVVSSDNDSAQVNTTCFDLLLIELVPMAQRIAEQVYESPSPRLPAPSPLSKSGQDDLHENIFYRLESLGYRVGIGLIESLSATAPLTPPPPPTTAAATAANPAANLDTIKFVCKELWTVVFRKQIDNLKTNHRGTFVLTDNSFSPLRRCSLPVGQTEEAKRRVVPFLQFPAGMVRGALSGLGVEAAVTVEVASGGVPGVVVTIKVLGRVGQVK